MKIAIVLDRRLPVGLLANSAAVLAFSVANHIPGAVGMDVPDSNGTIHPGITRIPIPILAADREQLSKIRKLVQEADNVGFVDFSDAAQKSKSYEQYTQLLQAASEKDLSYLGVCIYGDYKSVTQITGNIPLLR